MSRAVSGVRDYAEENAFWLPSCGDDGIVPCRGACIAPAAVELRIVPRYLAAVDAAFQLRVREAAEVGEGGVQRIRAGAAGEHGPWRAQVRGDVRVGNQGCGDRCESDEELGAKVCAQSGDEAGCCAEGDLFFDVEVEAVKFVDCDDGVQGNVVCFELLGVSGEHVMVSDTYALLVTAEAFERALCCAA